LDGGRTEVGQTSDASWTDVGRIELSRRYCDGRWRHCTAIPNNATLRQGQQSVTTRCYGEAGRALQLAAVARLAAGCSSLLRQWPTALQLVAMADSVATRGAGPAMLQFAAMADSALQPWPTLRWSIFVFFCFFFTRQLQERKRERQKEKGRENL